MSVSMTSLTRWVLDHKRLVLGFWVVLTIAGFAAIKPAGDALSTTFNIPGSEGFETNSRIAELYGNGGDVAPLVPVVTLPRGTTVDSPGVTRELGAALAKVQAALPEGAHRLLRLDGRPGVRLRRRPHDLRARLHPAPRRRRPRPGRGRPAQAALAGVTVGGAPVRVTGLDALRAAAADGTGRRRHERAARDAARRRSARCSCSPSSSARSWRSSRC